MASTSSSTPAAEVEVEERCRKRKRAARAAEPAAPAQPSKWRTRREHEIYSSKLLEAIRVVRAGPSAAAGAAAPAPPRGRAVGEAADRELAVAARGRTHWSRAILASRRRRLQAAHRARLRAPASPPSRHDAAAASASAASASAAAAKGTATPPLARKAKVLGRLVPGCRKLSFPTLLAETTDYIAALQMQVRAMTALAEALSAVSATSSPGAGSSSSSSPL
ncbi:transcription factor bHLH147-like [Miscanthus floridulus]|uniref:transcription factor bHLH147-like n=1 Tax=Miscanthus floridulus TaxID=154761 RepID=UPI003459DD5D